jgi:DNA (cytosine-5)-methyltransferase 1
MKRLLDLFCGAGGAGMGYHRAGFEVVGVDIKPQPHYPFEFHQADALEYLAEHGREFDAIHASPPCQAFSAMTNGRWQDRIKNHPDLIEPTRRLLIESGKPYVIENVIGAPLIGPVVLCGTMFGLETEAGNQLRRHRLFEASFPVGLVSSCRHNRFSAIGVYGGGQHPRRQSHRRSSERNAYSETPADSDFGISARRKVMGIDWMNGKELNQSIPPAYTEFIGRIIKEQLT